MDEDSIAIIGAACRLPGSKNLDEFWKVLSSGLDVVTEIPEGRWSKEFYFHPNPAARGKSYTWAAGIIDDIDQFDAGFFGISPRESEQVDPQQRILLELTWQALEDAGIPPSRIAGEDVGVFIGAASRDYGDIRLGDPASADAYFMTGTTASILANRISYIYDLHGASFTVDTACSSSLVALDLACRSIREKRSPMALLGGVSLLLSPFPYVGFCRASMLSPDGRCFAFDARANGYVRAEGAAMIVLKPLGKAMADGDVIRGVILGAGANSDGRTIGLSLPNRRAQATLLRSVYDAAGVSPDAVSFIEAHGTGTQAGDPVELSALGDALGRRRRSALPIGSVKTNVGHLEAASGMAGLLKAMLALQHRLLPASLHFETPNPNIPFAELNIEVVSKATELPDGDAPLIAGVNSFGFGGANAHAILAAPPKMAPVVPNGADSMPPLLISARSEGALKALARGWSGILADAAPEAAAPLLRAAARRRDHHRLRLVAWGDSPIEIADKLDAFTTTGQTPRLVSGSAVPSGKLAFVFSGNGVQKPGMARDALTHSSSFREALTELDLELAPRLGWSVVEWLTHDEDPALLARTDVAQPLLFAVQVGITTALRKCGIEPTGCVGHSVGEIAAGWAAGALSLPEACDVIVTRSAQQQRTQGVGGMAALGLAADEAGRVAAMLDRRLEIAAINSGRAVTVAGPSEALDRLAAEAARNEWFYKRLDLDYAFHSAALDPIKDDLIDALGNLSPRECGRRMISTVAGTAVSGRVLDAGYWWRNIRDPVRFESAINHMVADDYRIFVEIGPHPALLSYIRDSLKTADASGRVFGSLNHRGGEQDPFPAIAAECHVAGADLSAGRLFDGSQDAAGLPLYPWERQRHWFQPTIEDRFNPNPIFEHPLLGFRTSAAERVWSNLIDVETHAWIADHRVDGVAVMPGAGFLEVALAAARGLVASASSLEVTGFEIPRAMTVEADGGRELAVGLDRDNAIEIKSRPRLSDEPWTVHAVGRLAAGADVPTAMLEGRIASRTVGPEELYAGARAIGLDYGPNFRTVTGVEILEDREAIVALRPPEAAAAGDFILHPALLDGAMQAVLLLVAARVDLADGEGFLPSRFGRVRVFAPYGRMPATARVKLERVGTRSVLASIDLFDDGGAGVAEIGDCWFQRVQLSRRDSRAHNVFRFEPVAAPRPGTGIETNIEIDALFNDRVEPDAEDYTGAGLLFEAFLAAAAYEAVAAIVPPDEDFTIAGLIESGRVHETAKSLLSDSLATLERRDAAVRRDNGWRLASSLDLPDADLIWRTILLDTPELSAELALTGCRDVKSMLRRGAAKFQTPTGLIDQMLYASPSGAFAADRLRRAVGSIAARWPHDKPLRILEIGAGSGSLTRRLMEELAGFGGTLSYVASDRSGEPAIRLLSERPASVFSTVRWDPEDGQHAGIGTFDIIVSMYAFTRMRVTPSAVRQLHDMLAPGGILIGAEPEPNAIWESVFGQRTGNDTGSVPRAPSHGSDGFADLLARGGFTMAPPVPSHGLPWPIAFLAGRRNGAPARPGSARIDRTAIVIASSGDPLATAIVALLVELGMTARIIDPPEAADGAELIEALTAADRGSTLVLVMPRSAGHADARGAADRLERALTIARLMADTCQRASLWLVTRNAQARDPSDGPSPGEAALWGLGRVLANEMPQFECGMIDLPPAWDIEDAAQAIATECAVPDGEREIILGPRGRAVLKLRRGLPRAVERAESIALRIDQPGLIDTLRWKDAGQIQPPGPGEVSIDVRAAGLNFRDVMWALALLPEEALLDGFSGPSMGLECTGVVRALGEGVSGLSIGDRVMALAPAALRSHVNTPAHAVTPLPEHLSFEEGATIPVAYLTTIYALGHQARLEAGEWLLVHGGAGGVGMAAIAYARHRGAVIVATAGSAAKRAFLRRLGVDHVLDSRTLSFADDVRALTGGRGVDVVLNSLSGDAMERSLGLLKPFGRFVELGKRDFMFDTRVGLRALRQNISYYAVDIDRLPVARPDLATSLLREVADLMRSGALYPLPYRAFPFADAAEAFRLMQASGHIGKIVLTADGHHVPRAVKPSLTLRPDRTYLVTGGLSGFGLETAKWLAAHGARSLALLGRRGSQTEGAAEAVAAFAADGVDARAFACDVSTAPALERTLAEIRNSMPPLAGIVHAAMLVDDGLAVSLTGRRIQHVLAPKLDGALNLDRLTRADPIELFVLFSSATTVLGAPGQASYVAANMALEALAHRRRGEGLPALAVGWGAILDAGFLARGGAALDSLSRRLGTTPMTARYALDALPYLAASGEPVVAFAPVRFDAASQYLPILATPAFADVAIKATETGGADLRERLSELSPSEAKAFIISVLVEETGRILSLAPAGIDAKRPLSEFGMDSLMAVELRLALETRLGIDMPIVALSDTTSLTSIATRMTRTLVQREGAPMETAGGFAETLLRHERTIDDAHDPAMGPPPELAIGLADRVAAE